MYNQDWMNELKSKCDIASVVSRYVSLERKGRLLWGRCPFHGDKNPSLAINEVDGYYHCFACHAGGDVIKFVREIESVSFNEAIKKSHSCRFMVRHRWWWRFALCSG